MAPKIPSVFQSSSTNFSWMPAVVPMALAIVISTLPGYFILRRGFSDITIMTEANIATHNQAWDSLFNTVSFNSYALMFIGSAIGVICLWFVKIGILWCSTIVLNGREDIKSLCLVVSQSYIFYIAFSIVALIIFWIASPHGEISYSNQSNPAILFSEVVTSYFISLKATRCLTLIEGLRMGSEIAGGTFILLKLETKKILSLGNGILAIVLMLVAIHITTLWPWIAGIIWGNK